MIGKSTIIKFFTKVILGIVVLIFGVCEIDYFLNASKSAKLEIADILDIDNVDETTIEDDMACQVNDDGTTTIEYNGQEVYRAYVEDGIVRDVFVDGVVHDVFVCDDVVYCPYDYDGEELMEDIRETIEKYESIAKLMEPIEDGGLKVLYIPLLICAIILTEICIVFFIPKYCKE